MQLKSYKKKAKFHTCSIDQILSEKKFNKRGRPSKTRPQESKQVFHPLITIEKDISRINLETYRRSIFILATNELLEESLSNQELFTRYKDFNRKLNVALDS